MSITAPVSEATFDPTAPWALDERVALRDEAFGALAYHYGNRRLVFLKSRELVEVVRSLEQYPSLREAVVATVGDAQRERYERALAQLASSGVLYER